MILSIFLLITTAIAYITFVDVGYRFLLIFINGIALGAVLYLSFFGFTSSWRNFILKRNSTGLRAQILLIVISGLLIFPFINTQSIFFPISHGGAYAPVGVSLILGAFIFGIAMQTAGGCASGTLFSFGGGNVKMLLTLIFFIVGSTLGTFFFSYWTKLPSIGIVRFDSYFYLVFLVIFGILAFRGLKLWDSKTNKEVQNLLDTKKLSNSYKQHKLYLVIAVILIAVLSLTTLLLTGHPWSVTFGLSLWGSKLSNIIGLAPQDWSFWDSNEYTRSFLQGSILAETTSLMNIGLILGALLSSVAIGNFQKIASLGKKDITKAVLAGLAMGIGARLAYGCNIGALLGGIVSGSLHGWVWLVAAFSGSFVAVKLNLYK